MAKSRDGRGTPGGCKVSQKGGLSVYGLGRWPVTLYREQWRRLPAPATVENILAEVKHLSLKARD